MRIIMVALTVFRCSTFSLRPSLSTVGTMKKVSRHLTKFQHISMQSTEAPVRVRFAPSPTGSLHVGGARTALFNWLLARKTKGKFLVRVEDTDQARSTSESEKAILDDLRWMNMDWDEGPVVEGPHGPYRQSQRLEIYQKIANKLIEDGFAYRCFCTEEELEQKRLAAEEAGVDPKYDGTWRDADPALIQEKLDANAPYTVRFKVPAGKIVSIDDEVRGTVTWDAEACLGDFIILRSNGFPVYNFCVSVDDVDMKITHVVRAEEHLSNTLRQLLIMEALNYSPPIYAHCSLILGSDRSKLSKRHGATSVSQFSEQGFIPDAMMNYLANLGWNDGTDKEIYTPQELIDAFSLDRIVKSAAVFDMAKLTWVNAQHLRLISTEDMEPIVLKVLATASAGSGLDGVTILSPDMAERPISEHPEPFRAFLSMATKIAQRDMELTTDSTALVGNCLRYHMEETLQSDPNVVPLLTADALQPLMDALIADYDSGTMPRGQEDDSAAEDGKDFGAQWKAYMKSLGKNLKLKGKGLFLPVRLLLTGRLSGPDVGDQIKLLALSAADDQNWLNPDYTVAVSLSARIDALRSFSVSDAAAKASAAAPAPAAEQQNASV